MGRTFRCLGLCAAAFEKPGAAIAVARAGGIGIVDLEFCTDVEAARRAVTRLTAHTDGDVGLRAPRSAIGWLPQLLEPMAQRAHWLIIRAIDRPEQVLAQLPANGARRLLVEVTDASELAAIGDIDAAGIVARGHEAGGWVGQDSSFILLQKLMARQERPVFVQGGIGIQSAAACRAGGAAGVVLDDQLLLMPESSVPASVQRHLMQSRGQDARLVGERLDRGCRILWRPGFAAAVRLQELAERTEQEDGLAASWQDKAADLIGWTGPDESAWPVGQAIELAVDLRDRYKTTGRLVQAIERQGAASIDAARQLRPTAAGAPFAASHGLRYPIAQGPMTRVSDSARFADAVSAAGALPFLALALMSGEQVLKLLNETKALVGDRPWGVGLLGFVPKDLRDKQVEAIWQVKPPVALIAGGRPDQAAEFEQRGIATYIHVPSAELLRMFIDQGARRFVFEGRECGGHVGPLSSFVLWEAQIRVLLQKIPRAEAQQVHVLFAGGINDARSAAMVGVLAAPLVERGVRVGVLMGSAYLFTSEIVSTGAIVPEFQAQAVACDRTINVESGPGHATRCAVTPFAAEFYAERRRMISAGASADEVREKLEDMNLGRLRMASKGTRREGDRIVEIDLATQVKDGMYMIGQVATLRDRVVSVAELHQDVAEGSARYLDSLGMDAAAPTVAAKPSDVAIVGIGTLLPKALSPENYWHNILHKVNALAEVPQERFDWRLYFDADRRARDKIYSRWGGFLDEIPFDPMRYGIPPNSLRSIDPLQLLTLEVVRRALDDAGYGDGDFDRENTAVILGASGGLGDLGLQYGVRAELPRVVGSGGDEFMDRLPEWTEESFAGCLPNVAAGRVANRFDLGGTNFTVDAACASSLAAINLAVSELESGRCNVAIAGGIDTVQSPFSYLCFAKTSALSPKGQPRTFDSSGDGIVISEGLAVVVLKRLADAERAGDRIYAVIKAVAGSSDGKALGLTAPLPAGQMRAVNRAYAKAGLSPSTLGLIEAHGTGTPVGDRAETETITRTLAAANTPAKSCAVGSVKTILGHTKGTAGAAGLIKVALSLHHRVLPPHVGVDKPIEPIAAADSPVYLLSEAKPWFGRPEHPRRGAVSAFGFGGTNFHGVLEEYSGEYRATAAPLGASSWPCELLLFRGRDKSGVLRQIDGMLEALKQGASPRLLDLAYSLARRADEQAGAPCAVSVVAADLAQLTHELERLAKALRDGQAAGLPPYVRVVAESKRGGLPVAFLFPGQGTQHPNMGREAALYLRPVRAALEDADRHLRQQLPRPLTEYMFPPASFGPEEEHRYQAQLTDTRVAQPAIGALSAGFADLAAQLGLAADMTAGHSYGEFTALHAAGVLSRADFFALSGARGRVMAEACNAPVRGAMAAVKAERSAVEAAIAAFPGIVVANHNSPQQTVISGPEAELKEAAARLSEKGLDARLLPVAGAFHSRLMEPVRSGLDAAIQSVEFQSGRATPYSNSTGKPYPTTPEEVRRTLGEHMLKPVEFVAQIESMYAAGARVFVEMGPKSVMSGMVAQILGSRDHLAVAVDGGGLRGVLSAIGTLAAEGVAIKLSPLFDGRGAAELNLSRLADLRDGGETSPTTWMLSGGAARAKNDPVRKTGRRPMLTLETATKPSVENSRAAAAARPAPVAAPTNGTGQTVTTSTNGAGTSSHGPAARTVGVAANGAGNGIASAPATVPAARPAAAAPQPQPAQQAARASTSVDALLAYQETMRQFIALQEQVMSRFLSGTAPQPMPVPAPAPVEAPPRREAPAAAASVPASTVITDAQPVAESKAETGQSPVAPAADPSPTDGHALTSAEIQALLLQQVSDRTGYPPEMLGLDQDIEAELGIDSIKRVEILGALQECLPAASMDKLKRQMETLTRVKTLSGIIASLADGAVPEIAAHSVAVDKPAAPPPDESPASGLGAAELTSMLLQQVSDRTGYPTEMLGLEQDIEAELGIDSIKRVEVLGALQERLPVAMTAKLKQQMETLTRVKTLNGIVASLVDGARPGANGARPEAPATIASTATSAPAQAVGATALTQAEVTALLLQQISDRTGYPVEMLGLEQDIEAELGIDSIKRVEVLGALQERLPADMTARLKQQMEGLTRVKTLGGIVVQLLDGAAPMTPAAAEPAPVRTPDAPSAGPSLSDLTSLLLQQVSDRTGYPVEMLGLEQDIEAELGIDSIKRVEVLGALQERLPGELATRLKQQMEKLTRVKTLNGILQQLKAGDPQPKVAHVPLPAPAVVPAEPIRDEMRAEPLPRCVMVDVAEPLTGAEDELRGLYLIAQDGLGVAPAVAAGIEARGASAVIIGRETLRDSEDVETRIKELVSRHGGISGVIHLAGLTDEGTPGNLDAWRDQCRREVKSCYALFRSCAEELIRTALKGSAKILVASRLDGAFGRRGGIGDRSPAGGGALGLLKTALAEWKGVQGRGIDFARGVNSAEMANLVLAELLHRSVAVEVGYPSAADRRVFRTRPLPLEIDGAARLAVEDDWVVLVTGGARGITAQIAREFVRPGMRMIMVGRTPVSDGEAEPSSSNKTADTLRKEMIAAAASGDRVTPTAIERQVQRLLGEQEIRANLAALRRAGAEVEYHGVDVRDGAAFGALIASLYDRYGRIDAVIHGAGVIEDRLIADKTAESFDRVFDTKCDSAFTLGAHLRPETLKLLVLFTSVAGRYGNRGQGDYAAANEVLNRFAWRLRAIWPRTRVVSINWGPWDAAGMVSEEVKRQFAKRGLEAIAPAAGRRFFVDEVRFGALDDVEVVAGVGPWQREMADADDGAAERRQVNERKFLLIAEPRMMGDGSVAIEHVFDVDVHQYLKDHRLDGTPVLPAAAAAEWMAQFVQAAWPDWTVQEIGDVRVLRGFRLDGGAPRRALFRARASSHADAGSLKVNLTLSDPATNISHYRATATLCARLEAPREAWLASMTSGERLDPAIAYRDYLFHGPCFQLVKNISHFSAEGMDAEVVPSEPTRWLNGHDQASSGLAHSARGSWLFDPGLVDAALQLALVWSRLRRESTPLPARLGAITRYGAEPLSGPLSLRMRVKPDTPEHQLLFDALFIDGAGKVRLQMSGIECISSRALNRLGGTA